MSAAWRLVARTLYELKRDDDLPGVLAQVETIAQRLPRCDERAKALALLAQIHMLTEHQLDAIVWADRAIEEAAAIGAEDVLVQASVERATAMGHVPGRRAEGVALLRQAVDRAEELGEYVLVARGLNNLLEHVPPLDPEAPELLDRMKRAADRAGFSGLGPMSVALHSGQRFAWLGDAAATRECLDRAMELVPPTLNGCDSWAFGQVAELDIEQGLLDDAERHLDDETLPGKADHVWTRERRLRLAGRRGDSALVLELAADPALIPRVGQHEAWRVLLDRLEAGAAAGLSAAELRLVAERVLFDQLDAGPDAPPDVDGVELRQMMEAYLAAVEPDHERAAALLPPVLERLDGHLAVPYLASLEGLLARSLASLTRRSEALEVARRARARLERWPGWRRDELDALLARLEAAGDGELTAREREVAALLADGLTNAELARRLYISPRTAAVHVSNILMKLGMSNRAEVAAWAVRTGLARGPAA